MVIVEFFDRTPIENMISSIANAPEKVVFVGDKKRMMKQDAAFHRFLGCIVSSDQRDSGTYDWDWNEEFKRDVETMWRISCRNPGLWNSQLSMLDEMEQRFAAHSADGLHFNVDIPTAEAFFKKRHLNMNLRGIFYQLEKAGLISQLENEGECFRFVFKNKQIKRVLTKAGTILELKTFLLAKTITEQDGSPRYNDVMTGVFIDWDGEVHDRKGTQVDTENEIDLIFMRGQVPVFVSCKNGGVVEEELYKLNTVATRFGGAYARKVLIGTTLGKSGRGKQYFMERAKDMKIQVIDGVHEMSDEQFIKALKSKA